MRNTAATAISMLSLGLSGCVAPSSTPSSFDGIRESYLQGHLDMLATQAPWMTEAEREVHARAQADEVVKSLQAQAQSGKVVVPVIIPLPPAPSAPAEESRAEGGAAEPRVVSSPGLAKAETPLRTEVAVPTPLGAPVHSPVGSEPGTRPVSTDAPAKAAEKPSARASLAGTYVITGGSYSVTLEQEGDDIALVEPNKRSIYLRQDDGSYQFNNPDRGATFSMRILNDGRLEMGRVPAAGAPTVLQRVSAPDTVQAEIDHAAYTSVAQRYAELAHRDPDNVQAWTMCAAVAFKRSQADGEEFSRYATQMAETLKLIAVDGSNPCSDAIPDAYW